LLEGRETIGYRGQGAGFLAGFWAVR
jgi:hypothetical protein